MLLAILCQMNCHRLLFDTSCAVSYGAIGQTPGWEGIYAESQERPSYVVGSGEFELELSCIIDRYGFPVWVGIRSSSHHISGCRPESTLPASKDHPHLLLPSYFCLPIQQ